MANLDPMDVANFNIATRQARLTAGQGLAQVTFDQNAAQQDLTRQLQGLQLTGERTRNQLPGQFAQRGTLNSGIYKDALARYAVDQTGARDTANYAYQRQAGGLELQSKHINQGLTEALQNIELQKQARRAEIAAQLRGRR